MPRQASTEIYIWSMSISALKTLRDILKGDTFDGAYYVCGEDDFQKEDAMRRLIAAIVDPVTRDFNLEIRLAQDLDGKGLDAALSALPMMAQRRVLVIRDAGSLKKDARKALDRHLVRPASGMVILLIEASGGKVDKELAKNATVIEFGFLTGDSIPKWIVHHVRTHLKTGITVGACELLQNAVGTDLHQLVAELDKLASFTNGQEIDEAAVTAVVGVRRGETMADVLDEVAMKNATKALVLLPQVLSQPKISGVTLVMALTTQTIALSWGKARIAEGLSQGRLSSEYYDFLKGNSSSYTGRPWGSAVAAWSRAVERWTTDSLERAMDALLDADVALKETRLSSEEQVLATLIFSMCIEDERSIAA